jgi:hypothetical protein
MTLRLNIACTAAATLLSLVMGCALFDDDMETASGRINSAARDNQDPLSLPRIRPSRETLQVEIYLVERPLGDPLLRDILWDNIDESGALDPRVRQLVNQNGFRVGVAGSDPPQTLQNLLGLTTNAASVADGKGVSGRRVGLFEGTGTEIQTGPIVERCALEVINNDGAIAAHDFDGNVRCVLHLSAERFQPGWARLEFRPEVHTGERRLRHVAGENGWNYQTTQEVTPFFTQKFDVTINQGELVIIGLNPTGPQSLGHHFLIGTSESDQFERLLVVRLVDMHTTVGVRSE